MSMLPFSNVLVTRPCSSYVNTALLSAVPSTVVCSVSLRPRLSKVQPVVMVSVLLPYVYCCHAKFIHMNDDFEETTIPYPEIIKILQENNWDGYLLSEYEGADKYDDGYEVGLTLRKQHIMLKNLLGD